VIIQHSPSSLTHSLFLHVIASLLHDIRPHHNTLTDERHETFVTTCGSRGSFGKATQPLCNGERRGHGAARWEAHARCLARPHGAFYGHAWHTGIQQLGCSSTTFTTTITTAACHEFARRQAQHHRATLFFQRAS
jgi:hypothetical protein